MAQSEDAKLDDLKRLLRRLDKALPSVVTADGEPRKQGGHAAEPVPLPAKSSALRTAILAGGISLLVSLGVVAFWPQGMVPGRRVVAGEVPSSDPAKNDTGSNAVASQPAVDQPETDSVKAQAPPQQQELAAAERPLEASSPPPAETISPSSAPKQEEPVAAPVQAVADTAASAGGVEAAPVAQPLPAPAEATTSKSEAGGQPGSGSDGRPLAALDASQFLQRGLAMLRNGSLGAAQLLLERAADLGNGEAAFALATTYDGAPGAPRQASAVQPNADLALRWYERAQELGVEEARKRLAELKGSPQTGVVR